MPFWFPWHLFWVRPVLVIGAPIATSDPPYVIWPKTIVFRPIWWPQ